MKQTKIFILTTLAKQSLKQIQSQSKIYFCSAKLSHKTTDAALEILQNPAQTAIYADKPNSPVKAAGRALSPGKAGHKGGFLLPVVTRG